MANAAYFEAKYFIVMRGCNYIRCNGGGVVVSLNNKLD